MRILLIYPESLKKLQLTDVISASDPLALEYLAAAVIKDHDVQLIDARFQENWELEVEKFAPDIVGLTALTFQVNTVKRMSKKIKEMNSKIFIVVGGHHATVSPRDFYEPYIDAIVRGEGVFTFKTIVEHVEKKRSLSDIKGVSLNAAGNFVENALKPIYNLDKFPLPARSLHKNNQELNEFQDYALLITSQGCAFRCNFCSCWKATGGKYLTRDLKCIVDEIQTVKKLTICLADDESFLNPKRMMSLAEMIEKAGIKKRFITSARSDTIIKYPELFRKWKDAGLCMIFIGMEAFREKDLNYFNKKNSVDNNIKAAGILRDLGILVISSFIVTQDFEEKDFDDYAEFVNNLPVDTAFFNVLTPLPGTRLYEEEKANLITHNYDLFDLIHTVLPTKLPLKNFYREISHLIIRTAKLNNEGFNKISKLVSGKNVYVPPKELMSGIKQIKYGYLDHE